MSTRFGHHNLPYPQGMTHLRPGPEGFGAIGPLGNASQIAAGSYKVTGDGVYFRPVLQAGLPATGQALTIGDDFTATGEVTGQANSSGTFINFARGTSKFGTGYVAVQYLAPAAGFSSASYQPSSGGGGAAGPGPNMPAKTTTTTTVVTEDDPWSWLYWVAGIAAAGVVGYALFMTPKGQAVRRLARAKARRYGGSRRRR